MQQVQRVPFAELFFAEDGRYYHGSEKEPFTGLSFSLAPDGQVVSEIEYRDGHRWGLTREWHRNGQLAEESHHRLGVEHGVFQEWDKDGQLVVERESEHGITLWERERGADGQMAETYRLTEADPNTKLLEQFRASYGSDEATDEGLEP